MPPKKKTSPPEEKPAAGKLPADHFSVWVTLPRRERNNLGRAAGGLGLPMSEFARRAVLAAVRAVEAGRVPFPDGE